MPFGEFKWWVLSLSKCHLANSSGALWASRSVMWRIQVARFEALTMSVGKFKWRALRLSKCHLAAPQNAPNSKNQKLHLLNERAMPREAKHLRLRETPPIANANTTSSGRTINAPQAKHLRPRETQQIAQQIADGKVSIYEITSCWFKTNRMVSI